MLILQELQEITGDRAMPVLQNAHNIKKGISYNTLILNVNDNRLVLW